MLDPELEMQVDELCNVTTLGEPTEKDMFDIYCWIDSLEFSRPKKNITRDFSDGVLMAELIAHYIPKLVDIRNYYTALSIKNKKNNWEHLNTKVLSKLGMKIEKTKLQDIMNSKPGVLEKVLFDLRPLLARKNRTVLDYRRSFTKKPELEKSSSHVRSTQSISKTKSSDLKPARPQSRKAVMKSPRDLSIGRKPNTAEKRAETPTTSSNMKSVSRPRSQNAENNARNCRSPSFPRAKSRGCRETSVKNDVNRKTKNNEIPAQYATLESGMRYNRVEPKMQTQIEHDNVQDTNANFLKEIPISTSISKSGSKSTITTITTTTTDYSFLAEEYILSGNVSKPASPPGSSAMDDATGKGHSLTLGMFGLV